MKRTLKVKTVKDEKINEAFHLMIDAYPHNFQPNWITNAKHLFTEMETNIFLFVVNQLSNLAIEGIIEKGQNQRFYIPFSLIDPTLKNYNYIQKASKSLMEKKIEYYDDFTKNFDFITPFPRIRSLNLNGKRFLEVSMYSDVVPGFIELGRQYTKYDLCIALSLKSVYAKRFYQMVMQYVNLKVPVRVFRLSVKDLRFLLNCPENYRFADFHKHILKPSLKELELVGRIHFEVRATKKIGKAIEELEFSFKTEEMFIREEVAVAINQVNSMPDAEKLCAARQVMDRFYTLKSWQIDAILSNDTLLNKFVELDFQIEKGQKKINKSKTAYVVASLGLEKKS